MDNLSTRKLNNQGFTLLETMICFVLLGIIIVAAAQVIQSSTEVYYNAKSISYGLQISQATLTEIRGELENAQAFPLLKYNNDSGSYENEYENNEWFAMLKDGSSYNAIEFIGANGQQIKLEFDSANEIITEKGKETYTKLFSPNTSDLGTKTIKTFDSAYIGMGYKIKDLKFTLHEKNISTGSDEIPISNCPVIKIELTVYSDKWGEYSATDYAPLYNFYGKDSSVIFKQ